MGLTQKLTLSVATGLTALALGCGNGSSGDPYCIPVESFFPQENTEAYTPESKYLEGLPEICSPVDQEYPV